MGGGILHPKLVFLFTSRGVGRSNSGAERAGHRRSGGGHGFQSQMGYHTDGVRCGTDGLQCRFSRQSESRLHDGRVLPRGPGSGVEHPCSAGRWASG